MPRVPKDVVDDGRVRVKNAVAVLDAGRAEFGLMNVGSKSMNKGFVRTGGSRPGDEAGKSV